jgi:hypothetical protein
VNVRARSGDHGRLAAGIASGAFLLAGLAAGSHWRHVVKSGCTSPLESSAASSASGALSSSDLPRHLHTVSHQTKITPAPESAAPDLRSEPARSPQKFAAGLAPVLSATLGRNDPRYRAKNIHGKYITENPANHLVASFTDEGVELQRQQSHWAMMLKGWGYDESVVSAARVPPHATANRVEYVHEGLAEWYVNGPSGLEQSFRVAQAPWSENNGQHILALSFDLKGSWKNSQGARSRAVTLQDENGRPALRYAGLLARDASGRDLPAWMAVDGQSMRLEVAAQRADFPVTIDPMYSQVATLSATTGPLGAPSNLGFATSVSDDGTVVVVGACGYDPTTNLCSKTAPGAAYVFVDPAGGWQTPGASDTVNSITAPAAILSSTDSAAGDNFGYAVAISPDGTTIVVSAPGVGSAPGAGAGDAPGAAYVFTEPPGGWAAATQSISQTAKLLPSDSSSTVINFSQSLAISADGNTLVARSFNENTEEAEVYVFTAPGGSWQSVASPTAPVIETAKLAPQETPTGSFGFGLGISSDATTIVAGDAGANSSEGEAYVFLRPGSTWVNATSESSRLRNSDPTVNGGFGGAVAVDHDGSTIAVGAEDQNSFVGEAYVFTIPATGWPTTSIQKETTRLTSTDFSGSGTDFGQQVSIAEDGTIVIVGSEINEIFQYDAPTPGWPSSSIDQTFLYGISPVDQIGDNFVHGFINGSASANSAFNSGILFVAVPADNPNDNSGNGQGAGAIFVYDDSAVGHPMSLLPPAISQATAGTPYSGMFTVDGGHEPITFSATGTTPSGFALSPEGVLSGTPMQTGVLTFNVLANDMSFGDSASLTFNLTVGCPVITVGSNPSPLPNGVVNTPYSATFIPTGGVGAITFSETGLPTGIGMSFVGPVLSGTPTTAETFLITVIATDSNGCTGNVTDPVTINPSTASPPPPAVVTDNETITVSDAETFPDVADNEQITVSDAVTITPLISFAGPAASFSVGGLGFSGASGVQALTVSNVGEGSLVFSGAPVISSSSGSFTITQTVCSNSATFLPTTLPSGGACTLSISYVPSATPAADTSAIVFSDNAALSSPPSSGTPPTYTQTILLNGGGTTTAPLLPPSATVTVPTINETITVTDTPAFPDLVDAETITVNDSVTVKVLAPPPTITSVTPNSGPAAGGETVVIAGQNFQPGATVLFGSTPATSVTINSATSISVVVPALTPGSVSVTITNPGGQSVTLAGAFTITASKVAPTVSFTGAPASAANGFSFTVTATTNASVLPGITGSGACSAGPVSGTPASASATITMTSASGTCIMSAVWAADKNFTAATLTQSTRSMAVNTISPASGEQGQTLNVTMTGVGFVNGVTTANFGPNILVGPVTVTDSNDANVTITIPPNAPAGPVQVVLSTVTTGRYLVAYNFFVKSVAFSLSPTSGEQGQTLNLAIAGKGFVNGVTTANFGPNITAGPVTVTDSDDASVTVTIAPGAPIGLVQVKLTTGTSVNSYNFFVTPVEFSLTPTSGEQGQTLNVAIAGKGFVNGVTTANFGPNITAGPVTVTDSDDANVTITIPPGAPIGKVQVNLTTGTAVSIFNFFVTAAPFGLSPTSGERGQTLNLAIAGKGFVNGVTTANFGPNITAGPVTVTDSDDASVTITIAPGAPIGLAQVKVTTGTAVDSYNFFVTSVAYSLTPTSGEQGQTLDVAIEGRSFVNGVTTANFGPNIIVNYVTVSDADDATANITIAPRAPIGKVQVNVTTGTAVSVFNFFVTAVVYSLSPSSGAQGQTLNVAITGESFVNGVTTARFLPTGNRGAPPKTGFGITVHSVTVTDSSDATANITIGPDAPVGNVQFRVISGTAVERFKFDVLSAGSTSGP